MGDDMNEKRPVVPEGLTPETRQLAVREQRPRAGNPQIRALLGVVWASLGSTFVVLAPVFSNVLVAFGFALAMSNEGRRGRVFALFAVLAAGCASTGLLYGVYGLPMTVLSVVCAYALALGYVTGRLHTGGFLLAAAAVALTMAGIDMVSASLQGTSIDKVFTSVIDQALEESWGSLDLDGTAAVLEAKETLVKYWPALYFVVGISSALCSLLGAWLATRSGGAQTQAGMLLRYDVPLLVAELFALGVAAELLGPRLPQWQDEVAMVGANVVMCCRIALAQQGLSVLMWLMRKRSVSPFACALVVCLALWAELGFACASVLGLLDVGVNFRRLPRRRPDLFPRPTEVR